MLRSPILADCTEWTSIIHPHVEIFPSLWTVLMFPCRLNKMTCAVCQLGVQSCVSLSVPGVVVLPCGESVLYVDIIHECTHSYQHTTCIVHVYTHIYNILYKFQTYMYIHTYVHTCIHIIYNITCTYSEYSLIRHNSFSKNMVG